MSANFTPTLGGYKKPGSFVFWCQKILPLVYDDSLSYYELLCKVVDYINTLNNNCNLMLDELNSLKEYLENLPLDEYVEQALDDLIDQGRFDYISFNMLTNDAKLKTENDYVTPQMYGALADNDHDDTVAIQAALNSGKNVYFPAGTYKVTATLTINEQAHHKKIFATGNRDLHTAYIYSTAKPILANTIAGFTLDGISFNYVTMQNSTPYYSNAQLYLTGEDDLDIIIKNCHFTNTTCAIYARGRNLTVTNCLFYNFYNTGYCIYLDYNQLADEEGNTNENSYKNRDSGFRGFIITENKCHYTRNWLLDTTVELCKHIKGMFIANNILEAALCVHGYLNNAVVYNNMTFQLNHYDNDENRRDFIFNLSEMKNTIIDGYSATGQDAYVNAYGDTVAQSRYRGFLRCAGAFAHNVIKNIFAKNYFVFMSLTAGMEYSDIEATLVHTTISASADIGILTTFSNSSLKIICEKITESDRAVLTTNATIVNCDIDIKSNALPYDGYVASESNTFTVITATAAVNIPANGTATVDFSVELPRRPKYLIPFMNRTTSVNAFIVRTFSTSSISCILLNTTDSALDIASFAQTFLAIW